MRRPLCGRYPNGRTRPLLLGNADLHGAGPVHHGARRRFSAALTFRKAVSECGGKLAVPRQPGGTRGCRDVPDRASTQFRARSSHGEVSENRANRFFGGISDK